MRAHESYGRLFEGEPPFKFQVDIVDQDGLYVYGRVTVSVDGQSYSDSGYSVSFPFPVEYDLPELEVAVSAAGKTVRFRPSNNPERVVVRVEKAPPPPVRERETDSRVPPPPPRRVEVRREHVEVRKEVEYDPTQDSELVIELAKNEDVVVDPMEDLRAAFKNIEEAHKYDLVTEGLTNMSRFDVGKVVATVSSLAKVLNKELQQRIRGTPTIEYTTQRRGRVSLPHTMRTLATGNPKFVYRNLSKRELPRHCVVFVDISASTEQSTPSPGGGTTKVRTTLLLAALSIAETVVELGGQARVVPFSDQRNPNHRKVHEYGEGTRRGAIRDLLSMQCTGATRLDEALPLVAGLDAKTGNNVVFIFLDGAPTGGKLRADEDDQIQQDVVTQLRKLEEGHEVFVFWASSPNNKPEDDQFFFDRCERELEKAHVVNVRSFALFTRHASQVWQMPPQKARAPRAYNTDQSFPFAIEQRCKDAVAGLLVPGNQAATVDRVRAWVTERFKYTFPKGRPYRTAMEVFDAGNGCCGEHSNLIIGILRHFGIPCGVIEVKYIEQVRVRHACVGLFVDNKPVLIDVAMGESYTRNAAGNPVSDARWARLVAFWRTYWKATENRG
ncbi:MAG: transglutaminase domain-containing protein [Candidatus Lokiarchaeota archaeon]|nr:transglutaminase domain-containing protein [Candidatus Lokiarchaeota archaeon]